MKILKLHKVFVLAVFGAAMVFNPALASSNASVAAGLNSMGLLNLNVETDADAEVTADYTLPPGILHAPGIVKRIDDGKGLPPGLEKKVNPPTVIPDTLAPVIRRLTATALSSSATVVLRANEEVKADLYVSKVTPVVRASSSLYAHANFSAEHTFTLASLAPSTSYYFLVEIKDRAGNVTVSGEQTFKTEAADTVAPVISGPFAVGVTANSAWIIWSTNEAADSKVWYGTTTTIDTSVAANIALDSDVFFHSVFITGLTANSTYYFVVGSSDASGNLDVSVQESFTTQL